MSKTCPRNQTVIPWHLAPTDVMWAAQDSWYGVWRWYSHKPDFKLDSGGDSPYWWDDGGRLAGHDGSVFPGQRLSSLNSVPGAVAAKSLRRRPDHVTANR